MLYLDSSALVKLYVAESGSERVRQLVQHAPVCATSAIAYAEIRAAMARRFREGALSSTQLIRIKSALLADWPTLFVVPVIEPITMSAGDVSELHALRGMDAIHLASALWLDRQQPEPVTFSAWDMRLVQAAAIAGFQVEGPAN